MKPRLIRLAGLLAALLYGATIVSAFAAVWLAPERRPYLGIGLLFVTACFAFAAWAIGTVWFAVVRRAAAGALTARSAVPDAGAIYCAECRTYRAAVHCRTHHLTMCGRCAENHYDELACCYEPAGRRPVAAPRPLATR